MAGLAAARMSGGSKLHAAGPACEKARSSNLVHSRGLTYNFCWKQIADQYVLLRCWTSRWGLRDTAGICQYVFRTWSCTVWSQYDSGSTASVAPSGLAWRGRERPADERDVLQRSGRAAVARVLTAGRRLVLRCRKEPEERGRRMVFFEAEIRASASQKGSAICSEHGWGFRWRTAGRRTPIEMAKTAPSYRSADKPSSSTGCPSRGWERGCSLVLMPSESPNQFVIGLSTLSSQGMSPRAVYDPRSVRVVMK